MQRPVGVQADGDRIGRGVRAEAGPAGGDDPGGVDRGFGGGAGGGVVGFQGPHHGRERVRPEQAHHRRCDLGHHLLPGGGVGAPGAAAGDPVDRAVRLGVTVIALGEGVPQACEVLGVLHGGGFRGEQRDFGVPQPEKLGKFAGLGAGHGQCGVGALGGADGERGVAVLGDVADHAVRDPTDAGSEAAFGGVQLSGAVRQSPLAGLLQHRGQGSGQGRAERPVVGDAQVGGAEPSDVGGQGAQNLTGVLVEVLVDPQRLVAAE